MRKIDRRKFVREGLAGVTAVSAGMLLPGFQGVGSETVDQVLLGETNMQVSRLALGCGTNSWARKSVFTRAGLNQFLKVARHAHERGVTFIDTADLYGTHSFVRNLFEEIPRDNFQVMTKIWTENNDWNTVAPVDQTLERFKKELGTDYFDIVLLHCMTNGQWITEKGAFRDQLSEAKLRKQVGKVGVSCHNIDALRVAATDPWTDIILARINPAQAKMDGTPEEIMDILETAKDNGKGIIGMKIYGAGDLTKEELREKSLKFACQSKNIHAMTIGMEKTVYVDDTVERMMRLTKRNSG